VRAARCACQDKPFLRPFLLDQSGVTVGSRWSNPAITPLVGKPRSNESTLAGASFRSGETTLMPIDPSECRQHALDCVRMAQTANNPEARKVWSDLARTWLMFATDLEANEGLLDEWGRPKSQKHQTESWPCHRGVANSAMSRWSKSTIGANVWQVAQRVTAGRPRLANGADLHLTTSSRCGR